MIKHYRLVNKRLVPVEEPPFSVIVCSMPDEMEKRYLTEELKLDEHTLLSALDPDELARIEFEPEHIALIYKHPGTYAAEDEFVFRINSIGSYIFKDYLLVVTGGDLPLPEGSLVYTPSSTCGLMLKVFNRTIIHFREHLKVMGKIADEVEDRISASLSNQHLIHLFALQKSLVYYVEALTSNGALLERIRRQSNRIGFSDEEMELLEDTIIENGQCLKQAEISTNVLSNLMDARVSIVSNNLNVLMKTLNIITIGIMVPTFVVSAFSMNVRIPLSNLHNAFWMILGMGMASMIGFMLFWRYKKW